MKRPTLERDTSTASAISTTKTSDLTTMNLHHPSKTMTTLTRLRGQQEPIPVTPNKSVDEDEHSTILNTFNDKTAQNGSDQEEQQSDMYAPLSYDEADEDQLAEFFMTLDIDVSFGDSETVINNISEVSPNTERQSAKRRRLSNSGDSFSSSFSEETYDYDGNEELQRKQNIFRTSSTRKVAPIE